MDVAKAIKTGAAVVGSIGAIGSAAYAVDTRYAPAGDYATVGDLQSISLEIIYNSYWSTLDHLQEARQQNDTERERRMLRNAQRLLAKICALEPTFEDCSTGVPE